MGRKTVRWNQVSDLPGVFPGRLCSVCQGDGFFIKQIEVYDGDGLVSVRYVKVKCGCVKEKEKK